MWNALLGEGRIGQTPLTAWIAKENLRNLLACARTGADRHQVGRARWKFLTWCVNSDIPEVRQLASTVDRWWPEIEAFIDTGHSNAKSEGINRVIKLVARNASGFRNPDHQRPRTHSVTTRRARGHLRTAQLSLVKIGIRVRQLRSAPAANHSFPPCSAGVPSFPRLNAEAPTEGPMKSPSSSPAS
jgi:hypothetical protein